MIRYDFNLNSIPNIKEDVAIALGYFDGIHLGHIALINETKSKNMKSAIMTFNMGENKLIKRNEVLTTLKDRELIAKSLGVDYFLVLSFDEEVKSLSPKDFIERVIKKLNIKHIIVGKDYRFGYMANGDVDFLYAYQNKFYGLSIVNDIKFDNIRVSTTTIIEALKKGNISNVNKMLSRNYKIKGKVVKGLQNGTKFNYPTANMLLDNNYVLPKKGVYACYTYVEGKKYKSMVNVGTHPTIKELNETIVETHIFDFSEDIYGIDIDIEFISFIRDEKTFSTINLLKEQLKKDESKIRKLL